MTEASPTKAPGRRRWALWVVLLLVLAVALAIGVHRNQHPTLLQREQSLASEFRCPVCQGESVEQSQSPVSSAIRQLIDHELRAGRSEASIRQQLIASYGPSILERPQADGVGWAVWLVPALAVAVAVAGLLFAFSRLRRAAPTELTASEEDRWLVERALAESRRDTGSDGGPSAPRTTPDVVDQAKR